MNRGLLLGLWLLMACGGGRAEPPSAPVAPGTFDAGVPDAAVAADGTAVSAMPLSRHMTVSFRDDLCSNQGKTVRTSDTNQDGKPDVWRLLVSVTDAGGTRLALTCRVADLDFDGNPDMQSARDGGGRRLWERFDFDFDQQWDALTTYDPSSKQKLETARDTNRDGRFDHIESRENGVLIRVRKDRNGDERADRWEQYESGKLVRVHLDDDFDGAVDRVEQLQPRGAP